MYDDLIHELFPHRDTRGRPSYRPGQFEVIRDVMSALDDASVKDVIVEAPTGAGKTSVAVTVARIVTRKFHGLFDSLFPNGAAEGDAMITLREHQAHLITSMKMLQDAYLGDDPTIRLVKGKSNYACIHPPKGMGVKSMKAAIEGRQIAFSCEDAEHMYGHTCGAGCPYQLAKMFAQRAPIALHNFDSFLYQTSASDSFGCRRLLTVDEAHNCEDKLRSFLTTRLSPSAFKVLDVEWLPLPDLDDMTSVLEWARELLGGVDAQRVLLQSQVESLRESSHVAVILEAARVSRRERRLMYLGDSLRRFVVSIDREKPARWVAQADNDDVILEPVDAGRYVPQALLKYGRQRVHLSATFLDGMGVYSKSIRLDMKTTRHLVVPSSFAKERRPIVCKNSAVLSNREWEDGFPRALDDMREILSRHGRVRGVIHCTSYDIAELVARGLKSRRLVTYDRANRESVVNEFMSGNTAKNAVLVAVALGEGYDFKYDLCRFQIIIRIPYLPPSKCMNARREMNKYFYGWKTSLSLVQTYGRGMRSADDECVTYVLDSRFDSFVNRERRQLPGWFLEAICLS